MQIVFHVEVYPHSFSVSDTTYSRRKNETFQICRLLFIAQIICVHECFLCFPAVCVAGCSPAKNEILELRLPLKLLADENKVKKKKKESAQQSKLWAYFSRGDWCHWAFPVPVLHSGSLCRTGFQSFPRWFHRWPCSMPHTHPWNEVSSVQCWIKLSL